MEIVAAGVTESGVVVDYAIGVDHAIGSYLEAIRTECLDRIHEILRPLREVGTIACRHRRGAKYGPRRGVGLDDDQVGLEGGRVYPAVVVAVARVTTCCKLHG